MLKSARKFAVLLLLLVMPLQGVAASLTESLCSTTTAPVQTQPGEGHSHDGHASGPQEPEGGATAYSAHLCCHHFFAAIPAVAADAGRSERPAFEPQHRHFAWLFFPEQPQRVPLV